MCEIEEWVFVEIDDEEEMEMVPWDELGMSAPSQGNTTAPKMPAKVEEGPFPPTRIELAKATRSSVWLPTYFRRSSMCSRGCSTFRACGTHSLLVAGLAEDERHRATATGRHLHNRRHGACATRSGITWADGLAFIRSGGSSAAVLRRFLCPWFFVTLDWVPVPPPLALTRDHGGQLLFTWKA